MPEQIKFAFEGKLASQNEMDFYEFARFQYSASRLLVKLDNFRKTGSFPKKITYKNTPDIKILPSRPGSFILDVIAPALAVAGPLVYELPISYIFTYVVDRIFRSAGDDDIRAAIAHNDHLLDSFDQTIAGRDDTIVRTLDMLRQVMDRNAELHNNERLLYERLLADQGRKSVLRESAEELRKIAPDAEADLVTMAAPLLKEMNVPLRRSSNRLNISATANDNRFSILTANKEMADSVDTEIVDRQLSTIDIDVVQFNKESGWGKFENDNWEGRPSFSVPGELLDNLKQTVVNSMHEDMVEVDCYIVRSTAGLQQRIIVTDIRRIDE